MLGLAIQIRFRLNGSSCFQVSHFRVIFMSTHFRPKSISCQVRFVSFSFVFGSGRVPCRPILPGGNRVKFFGGKRIFGSGFDLTVDPFQEKNSYTFDFKST